MRAASQRARSRTRGQLASPNFRYLEVRILDDAHAIAKRIFDSWLYILHSGRAKDVP
jgi:hypothetical protein